MKEHAFVVTKPLQLIIALSIMRQLKLAGNAHVIVVDSFSGARGACERLASLNEPVSDISVEFVKSTADAYRLLRRKRFSSIFIDSDVGLRRYSELALIKLSHPGIQISVYEEGAGTYRSDLYSKHKRFFLNIIGAGTFFGGCQFTSNIYVFQPELLSNKFSNTKKTLLSINCPMEVFISDFFEELSIIFNFEPIGRSGDHCHLYLSNWSVNDIILEQFRSLAGDKYIKPHPHMNNMEIPECNMQLSAALPAEMLIMDLRRKYKKINIYHHGSSTARYISSDNIVYIRV